MSDVTLSCVTVGRGTLVEIAGIFQTRTTVARVLGCHVQKIFFALEGGVGVVAHQEVLLGSFHNG